MQPPPLSGSPPETEGVFKWTSWFPSQPAPPPHSISPFRKNDTGTHIATQTPNQGATLAYMSPCLHAVLLSHPTQEPPYQPLRLHPHWASALAISLEPLAVSLHPWPGWSPFSFTAAPASPEGSWPWSPWKACPRLCPSQDAPSLSSSALPSAEPQLLCSLCRGPPSGTSRS